VTREDREYARLLLAPPTQQEDGDGCDGADGTGARDDGSGGGISGWAGLLPAPRAQQWLGAAAAYGGGGGNEGRATGSSSGSNDDGGQSAAPTPPPVLDLSGLSLKGVGFGGSTGAPAATSFLISRGV
jgi:hypothetical protein